MHFVSVHDQIGDWTGSVRAVHGNAESIGSASWTLAPLIGLLNIVDIVVPYLNVGTVAIHTYARGNASGIGGTIVADF